MPIFEIANFDTSGLPVKMYVYAQNAKGSSEPFVLEETFKPSASISNSAEPGKRHKHAGVEGKFCYIKSQTIQLTIRAKSRYLNKPEFYFYN